MKTSATLAIAILLTAAAGIHGTCLAGEKTGGGSPKHPQRIGRKHRSDSRAQQRARARQHQHQGRCRECLWRKRGVLRRRSGTWGQLRRWYVHHRGDLGHRFDQQQHGYHHGVPELRQQFAVSAEHRDQYNPAIKTALPEGVFGRTGVANMIRARRPRGDGRGAVPRDCGLFWRTRPAPDLCFSMVSASGSSAVTMNVDSFQEEEVQDHLRTAVIFLADPRRWRPC